MAGAAGQGGGQPQQSGVGQPNVFQQASGGLTSAMGGMEKAMNYTPQQVAAERAAAQGYDAERIAGVGPVTEQTVQAAQLAQTSMDPYMNPYIEQVVKANEADILRGATMGLNTLGAQAQAAKAFGGSRQAIAEAEYGRNVAQQLAQSSAGLRQQGFAQAQAAAQQDLARQMQAQQLNQAANLQAQTTTGQFGMQQQLANQAAANQAAQFGAAAQNAAALANQQAALQAAMANQQAGLTANQQRIGAASGLGSLANLGFGMGQQTQQTMAQQGALQQGINQSLIDAAKGQYGGYTGAPASTIGYLSSALGATPVPQTTTTSKQPGLFDYLTLALG